MGASNKSFFGVKEQQWLNRGVPLTLGFFPALAGWEVAIGLFTDVYLTNLNQWLDLFTKMLEL
jgi:hypothetical protein